VNPRWRAPARALAVFALTSSGCEGVATTPEPAAASSVRASSSRSPKDELAALRSLEEARRSTTDFARRRSWDDRSGADPIAVARLDDTRWLGLERGLDSMVVLDGRGRTLQRLPAPSRPTGLVVGDDGVLWVVGEGEGSLARYRLGHGGVTEAGRTKVSSSVSLRDVAAGPGNWVYVADRHQGRVRAARLSDGQDLRVLEELDVIDCAGALRVQVAGPHLVAVCMLEHTVAVAALAHDGRPLAEPPLVIEHDGPMWSLDAVADDQGLSLVVGGVEDRPLDRSDGSFGFIDAYAFAYRIEQGAREWTAHRRAEINVSHHGVIMPKALRLQRSETGHMLTVSGYGGDRMVELGLDARLRPTGHVRGRDVPAGIAAFGGGLDAAVAANPLLDAWIAWDEAGEHVVQVHDPDDDRTPAQRLGEALVFTRAMAPWNESAGRSSRFTCETCHFEGTTDGRTHWTGREQVHATTKTLQGLFENRPYFTRALDDTMTKMVHNEFRVANLGSGVKPWFTLTAHDAPWIRWLDVDPADLDPAGLRRSLMMFLMDFTHAENPVAAQRSGFDELERRGATLFAEHCEGCHQARLVTDVPGSRVPLQRWEALVFAGGPIVWAEDARRRTGIEPYVHPDGARTPSLRRLWVKRPYFTNGSANDLMAVLERVLIGKSFAHAGIRGEGQDHLAPDERRALVAFMQLL
jgi:hypothetical protein